MDVMRLVRSVADFPQKSEVVAQIQCGKVFLVVGGQPVCGITIAAYEDPIIQKGNLEINTMSMSVSVEGRNINLTATEYKVLMYLAQSLGVARKESIFATLWRDVGDSHIIDVYVCALRRKLAKAGWSKKITNVRGVGFRID